MKHTMMFVVAAVAVAAMGCSSSSTKRDKSANLFAKGVAKPNSFWFPEMINLNPLRQHAAESNPYGDDFDYAKAFKKLNLKAVKADISKVLKDSQPWWPADYGTYAPFFIRMAWHSAGTYRIHDGRGGAGGGQQRFEPLNSWPDNGNLDKARRLLWPIKKKYGRSLSWADIMVLAGNVALEDMGFQTFGFAGGRSDDWEPDLVYWGPEHEMLEANRRDGNGKLRKPLGAVQMGLIYVNPEGPGGNPDPLLAAKSIRESFGLMAMNDEETAALIAGGHTFGKAHGAHKVSCVGKAPSNESLEKQGFGWKNKCGKGHSEDTVTSGLEGAWTSTPTQWSMQYLANLYAFEWEKTKSPTGAIQWVPKDGAAANTVPDAHIKGKKHQPIMFTTDLALKFDPAYRKITQGWLKDPKGFERAFAKAWFKLTHRDMGPRARYIGSESPKEILIWQDPVPKRTYRKINNSQINSLKKKILASGLTIPQLVRTAWASASSFRDTDMRGGANGARVRLAPQSGWAVNNPDELASSLKTLTSVQEKFNKSLPKGVRVSLADTIVLGGVAAVEKASRLAGNAVRVPFKAGRTDATEKQTDAKSFEALEPKADGFRNYYTKASYFSPVNAMIDKAALLGLSVPEMTVLVGGMRALNANTGGTKHGVFTDRPGQLSNDFFVNLLDMSTMWRKASTEGMYEGVDRASGKVKYTATAVDLMFGSSAELRAIAEVYASDDGRKQFAKDFAAAFSKVMHADMF
ncbi:MAG: catalase/peroxidase HPI [Bdellovibrionales bacterium]|nr:catalase/peroxidase HPI [Bdellovibrionales bacterium]